ncbi:hypothetical protein LEP1GSC187_0167 [Leptospira santarosai str. ZUN179]|uniref:Uncharacterized protein n=1 Tax=Leptospira santarosai str. ZUN179 TaxID=1049985 RepID=M6UHB3_9LEPT|nr:hypothetical protein LEP1GSC187_0167 [Leptospira santarosai str. ZUN179]
MPKKRNLWELSQKLNNNKISKKRNLWELLRLITNRLLYEEKIGEI